MNALVKIYDLLHAHRRVAWGLLSVLLVGLMVLACQLRFHEDIMDFLPHDEEYAESMRVYSSLSEASRIVVIFEGADADSICLAIDAFGEEYESAITEVDVASFLSRLDYVYVHMPYFLTEADYDTLSLRLQHAEEWVLQDKRMLSMPGSSFLYPSISHDPLRLIPVAKGANGQYAGAQSAFTSYDGYMMTSDYRMGFAFYDSPYGSTETGRNAALVDSLHTTVDVLSRQFPTLSIRLLGAPVVAVGNARRIKRDSVMAILVSLVLITLLLIYAFPRTRDIALIALSIAFGWLFGMAALALMGQKVSVIVLGIGAVLIGIAVNYPLHILVHQRYTSSVRQTLQEVLQPLLVGNITTIGAFMALIPLTSPALRQLGVFASAMFFGTILFCIVFLPLMMSSSATPVRDLPLPHFSSRTKKWAGISLLLLIIPLALLGIKGAGERGLFDSNLSHLNYMTARQRADFAYFESLSPMSDEKAYLVESARQELRHRETLWLQYWESHDADSVAALLRDAAVRQGFRAEAFEPFIQTISSPHIPADLNDDVELASLWPGRFDSQTMNEHVTVSLTDNFDYLGLVCSIIVLVFLCLSFRSVVLGLIAFLPMLISWVLIYGLMMLFGLHFNIVNVILATFIFGQGDDYTIFVLEGHLYERRTGQKMLPQYIQSIVLSAIIMLLAIGVLTFASHPAMHSLGAVTLIGMACVVVCAIVLPPLFLNLVCRIPFFRKQINVQ